MVKKRRKNPINNLELEKEIFLSQEKGELTPRAIELFVILGDHYILKNPYWDEQVRKDCKQAGFLALFSRWKNFNPEFGKAFSYYTEIFKRGTWEGMNSHLEKDKKTKVVIRKVSINRTNNGEGVFNI